MFLFNFLVITFVSHEKNRCFYCTRSIYWSEDTYVWNHDKQMSRKGWTEFCGQLSCSCWTKWWLEQNKLLQWSPGRQSFIIIIIINLKNQQPLQSQILFFPNISMQGNKKHLTNSSCWQEPCTVGPVEPTPTGIEEKVIKSTFRFSLFASGFREKAWRRREAFWTFPLGHKGGESKTECSAKICSLYKRWKYYMHIHTMFFQIWSNLASMPYHCSLALCLWWNTNISRLVHLQYIYNIMTLIGNP